MSEPKRPAAKGAKASTAGAAKRASRRVPKALQPTRARQGPLTVFTHIPKTAGTTVIAVLRDNFPHDTVRVIGNVFHSVGKVNRGGRSPIAVLRASGQVLTRDLHLLGGHVPYGVHQYLPSDARYITFLRDPVERTLSHYYRILSSHRKSPVADLPEEPSLEQLHADGEYLHDNLQTRFLSGVAEPFDEVTEEMFENAKKNLAESFVAFGLVERFDESLVLLKRRLGLRSVLYVSKRMTPERPRTAESKAELVPLAERFNAYDLQLYEFACKRFESMVAEEGSDFAVEVAALKAGVSKDHEVSAAPPASVLSRDRMWKELVRARAELLGWEFDFSNSRVRQSEYEAKLTRLLQVIEDRVDTLGALVGPALGLEGDAAENGDLPADETRDERRGRRQTRRTERSMGARTQKEARLEELYAQIAVLEEAVGERPEGDVDPHVVRELERLRASAAEAEEEVRKQKQRKEQVEKRGAAQEERQAQQRQRKIAALVRQRDTLVTSLEDAERRLDALRESLARVQPADRDDEQDLTERQRTRLARLREQIAQKETQVEQLGEKISSAETELVELNGGAVVEDVGPPPAESRLEDLRARIRELERSAKSETDLDARSQLTEELERLQGVAAQVEDRLRRYKERKTAPLIKQRDTSAALLENAVRRLDNLEETLRGLQPEDGPAEQEARDPERRHARIERLEELIDQKRSDVEMLRERIADAERQLSELNGDAPAGQEPSQVPEEALASEG